jgi:hypothetical protein
MMTLLAGLYAFLLEHWLVVAGAAVLVGGWLFVCRELCLGAELESEEAPKGRACARRVRRRVVLSSRRQRQHAPPQASFRIRRS